MSSASLSSATQHAMPPEFGRKWGTECLNTGFPLPTLLCAGYSVKLIYLFYFDIRVMKQDSQSLTSQCHIILLSHTIYISNDINSMSREYLNVQRLLRFMSTIVEVSQNMYIYVKNKLC